MPSPFARWSAPTALALLLGAGGALALGAPASRYASEGWLNVRRAPEVSAPLRGRIAPGEAFEVLDRVEGQPEERARCALWGQLPGGGYACLDYAAPSEAPLRRLPVRIPFEPPTPEQYASYLETGSYEPARGEAPEALLPFIYGKRWRRWSAPVYADPVAFAEGEAPYTRLQSARKFHFLGVEETERGEVLTRDDGRAVPLDQVFLYPVSRLQGVNLEGIGLPEGRLPAWSVGYEGAALREAPSSEAASEGTVGGLLPYHTQVWLDDDVEGGPWWRLSDGLGLGVPGFVDTSEDVRRWVPAPAPPGVEPHELWLDVDLGQQVLALRRGPEELLYVTLVSTGRGPDNETPKGLYRIGDKAAWGDMASRAGADDSYHVESVPWVMHFWPRYALHGVFWHWGFGRPASHGCVNLAPKDAAYIFERVAPTLEPGWHTVWEDAQDPGTLLRVRDGSDPVPDRRR